MTKGTLKYFGNSFLFSIVMLILSGIVGYIYHGTLGGVLTTVFITCVLSVLEVSLSFDNAVVNAKVLKQMTPVWQHRFITWGIAIAVFGMRVVFPLLIVGVVARIGPIEVIRLATFEPDESARILTSAHVVIAGFGGAFLAMVSLKYFFDHEKDVHWIRAIERPLSRMGRIEAVELGIVMLGLYVISKFLPAADGPEFIVSGLFGLLTYILVDGIAVALKASEESIESAHKTSAALFLYLEVLDASFSFDGVIGAFALTHNLFVIAIGLGIGAMFVRSLTIMLVEKESLSTYRYLEHGAFYAIGALAVIMFLGTVVHIPEVVTGLIGAAFILVALWNSITYNRAAAKAVPGAVSAEVLEQAL
ncbi:MAG: DUF475 domain-containing protein [Deltaproteobacteria bacterium]|nr:DUF475 domain-containing protein [Deltaproteobacteria bacterium]